MQVINSIIVTHILYLSIITAQQSYPVEVVYANSRDTMHGNLSVASTEERVHNFGPLLVSPTPLQSTLEAIDTIASPMISGFRTLQQNITSVAIHVIYTLSFMFVLWFFAYVSALFTRYIMIHDAFLISTFEQFNVPFTDDCIPNIYQDQGAENDWPSVGGCQVRK